MAVTEIVESSSAKSVVDWGAVFAGAAVTTALALVLLAFGAALGLSVSSPYEGEGAPLAAFAIAAGLYLLWVQLMSFYIGGYIAARLRPRANVSEHEADVRDGLHGLAVWATGVLAAAVITFAGIGGLGVSASLPENQAVASASQAASQEVDEAVNQAAAEEKTSNPEAVPESATERRADIARKLSVISAFITAASLLAGAVAAFLGAHSGGNHRDKTVVWAFFTSQSRLGR
jgi:hypothetical protein